MAAITIMSRTALNLSSHFQETLRGISEMNFKLPIPTLELTSLVQILQVLLQIFFDVNSGKQLFLKAEILIFLQPNSSSKLEDNIKKLPLPAILKEKLTSLLEIMYLEILDWSYNYQSVFHLPEIYFWTSYGTIDYEKMADMLVKDNRIDIIERYQLACFFCLEKDISNLWKQLDAAEKRNLLDIRNQTDYLMIYWSYYAEGELHRLDISRASVFGKNVAVSPEECGLLYSARMRNKEATRYFLKKIEECQFSPQEKENILTKSIQHRNTFDISFNLVPSSRRSSEFFFFLLSQCSEKQQKELIRNDALRLFYDLEYWPWCNLIDDVLNLTWDFLSKDDYIEVFEFVCLRLSYMRKNWYYQSVFYDFWNASPIAYKKHIVNKLASETSLHFLISGEREEIIKCILDAATVEEKEKLLSIKEECADV